MHLSEGKNVTEPQWDLFKRCEMKAGWIPELKALCDSLGVEFFSTPTSEEGVRELVEVRVPLLKNGSDYRAVNNKGDGTLFDRSEFQYDENTDTFRCPAGQSLVRKELAHKDRAVIYAGRPEVCGSCPLKTRCTTSSQRFLTRHLHDDALQRMQQRTTPRVMRLRRSTVEHPFATLKYRIFGHPRFLLRGTGGAQTEMSLATIAYNLKRMMNVLGGQKLAAALSD